MLEQQLINALSLGSVYALFALGFTLVFGVLGVINLSHGAVFMLGSYAALLIVEKFALPLWLGMVVAMLFVLLSASITTLRAREWSDPFRFSNSEVT